MNIRRCQAIVPGLAFICVIGISGHALADDGPYLGMDLGLAIAPSLHIAGSSNDWATKCDIFLNPNRTEVANACDVQPPPSAWRDDIDGGVGILSGFTLGYRLGNFRGEGEYFYRTTTHDDRSGTRIGDDATLLGKLDQEIDVAEGGVDDVTSHNAFANLYYDIPTTSKFTPYIGIGVGIARVTLDYFSRWKRNHNAAAIATFADPILRERLAGTTSIGSSKLTDTMLGYQALAGIDYQVSAQVSLGVKIRWTDFDAFSAKDEWDQLRSHDSTIRPGGDRIWYSAKTDDMQFFGASLNLKYHF